MLQQWARKPLVAGSAMWAMSRTDQIIVIDGASLFCTHVNYPLIRNPRSQTFVSHFRTK